MPVTALALVVVAALLHALWNIAAKKAGGGSAFALLVGLLILGVWLPVGIWAGWTVVPQWGLWEWGLVLASALLHHVYFHTLLRGYRLSDLTVVYPVARGTGPLVSSLGAIVLLGEGMALAGGMGVLAMAAGVFLIAGGPGLWAKAHDPAQRQRVHKGLAYGTATGVLISGYTLVDAYAVKVALISPILIDYFGNLLRIPFMLPHALRHRAASLQAWRKQWKYALVVACISPLGYVLVLYAVRLAPVSHVAPAREVSMLFAALLGGKLLGEGDTGLRLAGAACIAGGVVALAMG
jgi:drug/metabolite transporter (DMT)-like permease